MELEALLVEAQDILEEREENDLLEMNRLHQHGQDGPVGQRVEKHKRRAKSL